MIAVVDYQKGNLKSVERALVAAGAQAVITSDPEVIKTADAIVLPGVGAFADASATMIELGQMDAVRERVEAGVPFLGICLGMHLMFAQGIEGAPAESDANSDECAEGLGFLPGLVGKVPSEDEQGNTYKIPHVGWNQVMYRRGAELELEQTNPLFEGIPEGEHFYFTHSYCAPANPASIAYTTHSIEFPVAVQYGQCAFGLQFHPEKSSDAGVALLRNFVRIAKEA